MKTLYGYFRSSAAFRVRIALNLKGLDYERVAVHIAKGKQYEPEFRSLNAQALVPVFRDGDISLTQSLAIIEYLDEVYPEVALMPRDAIGRARVRALSLLVACEIHPLNNLRVLRYLTKELGVSEAQKNAWYHHWVNSGLADLEQTLTTQPGAGKFCYGDSPTLADLCLVPQLFNARRFEVDLTPYPTLLAIDARCMQLQAFQDARPAAQPDAE